MQKFENTRNIINGFLRSSGAALWFSVLSSATGGINTAILIIWACVAAVPFLGAYAFFIREDWSWQYRLVVSFNFLVFVICQGLMVPTKEILPVIV